MSVELANQCTEGRAPESAELLFVNLLEQGTLIEVDRPPEILEQFTLAGIEQPDLEILAGGGLPAQVMQAAPCALQALELRCVQDLAELCRDQRIELRNARIEACGEILAGHQFALEDLLDQFPDEIPGPLMFGARTGDAALIDDTVQKAATFEHRLGLLLQGVLRAHCSSS